jgi:hypothetical protein
MAHEFKVLVDGKVKIYSKFEDIPLVIDNVISFKPEIPEGPHTEEQHHEIHEWEHKFKELMKRETM